MKYYSKHVNGVLTKLTVLQNTDPSPADSIEITEDEFKSLSSTQPVDDLRASALDLIDQKAGEVRLRFITAVPGQSETYMMKAEEASKAASLGFVIDIADYPMIKAEMDATGVQDVTTICTAILTTMGQWKYVASIIERERRHAKIAISGSSNVDYIISERDGGLASLDSIR